MTSQRLSPQDSQPAVLAPTRPIDELHADPPIPAAAGGGTNLGGFSLVRRRASLVLAMLLCAWCLAGLYMVRHAPAYTSTTSLFLTPVPGNALSTVSETNSQQLTVAMQTEARLVQSPGVAALAAEVIGPKLAADTGSLSASVPANTQIVRIQFTASTPTQAVAGARGFATAFLRYRNEQGKASQDRQLANLRTQSLQARQHLKQATKQAGSANPPSDASTRVQLYSSRLASISTDIGQIQSEDIAPGTVVASASPAQMATLSTRPVIAVVATLLGLCLGVGVAWARDRADRRLHARRQAQTGGVPIWPVSSGDVASGSYVDELDVDDPDRETYRTVRAALIRSTELPSVVTVVRDAAAPSVVQVALNLALSLRDAHYTVALVDASLEPNPLAPMAPPCPPGLVDHLKTARLGGHKLHRWRGLSLLFAGTGLDSSRDLLASPQMSEIIEELRSRVDCVVIAGPEASSAAAIALGAASDATVLVARDGLTTHPDVHDLIARHDAFGSSVIGVIAVPRPAHGLLRPKASPPTAREATAT